jgi:serine O-acetyltransferase
LYFSAQNFENCQDVKIAFSNEISFDLPASTRLPHPVGIVILSGTPIGEDCVIHQNVTIGKKNVGDDSGPTIGDDVVIGCGASILGDIEVGDDVVVGANAVVLDDVPDGSVVAGVPARVVGER